MGIKKEIEIEITPRELAEIWCSMDSGEQSEVFNQIAVISSVWELPLEFQLAEIGDGEDLTVGGRKVMSQIGEFSG